MLFAATTCFNEELSTTLHASQAAAEAQILTTLKERHSDLVESGFEDRLQDLDLEITLAEAREDEALWAKLWAECFPTSYNEAELSEFCGQHLIWDTWSVQAVDLPDCGAAQSLEDRADNATHLAMSALGLDVQHCPEAAETLNDTLTAIAKLYDVPADAA